MGVRIIKGIDISNTIYCFKNCCGGKNSEIIYEKFNNNKYNGNDNLPSISSNKIVQINTKNRIKNKIINKFPSKKNSFLSFSAFNMSLTSEYKFNHYKFAKVQAYIRGFLQRKKISKKRKKLDFINSEKKKKENYEFLAISMKGNISSNDENSKTSILLNNNKEVKFKDSINIFPFNLQSKKNMKYKYYGYVKHWINDKNPFYINISENNKLNIIKNGFGKIIFNDNTIFKTTFIEKKDIRIKSIYRFSS